MRRRLSPALWPKVSLMPLKRLRSMNRKTPSLVPAEPAEQRRAVDPDLLAVRKPGDRVVEGELADAPEARAQVRQHGLEGDAEAVDLAEAGRPERHLEIALGDGGRRPRQLRQAAGRVPHRDQERADEGDEGARREHQEPDHQRARLLGADAEHLLLGGLHLRGSGMGADLEIGDIVDAARDVRAIEAVEQLVLADVVVAQLQRRARRRSTPRPGPRSR